MVTQVTRALALFAGLMVVGLTMSFTATYRNTGTIITAVKPGLAMELLERSGEVDALLGPASTRDGAHNRSVMRHQQYLDFVLIPLYVSFLALIGWQVGSPRFGVIVVIAIVAAGIFDYFEDFAILAACKEHVAQAFWPISFGAPKWMFYFAATGMLAWPLIVSGSPIFQRDSLFSRVLRWIAGTLFAVSAAAGIVGTIVLIFSRRGELLNYGTQVSFATFLAIAALLILEVIPKEQPVQKILQKAATLLTGFLRLARYAYLLRVPIMIGATLFVFPFAALYSKSPLRALFQNLFLLDGGGMAWPWPTFFSTMAALVLAWSVLLTSRIVLLNSQDRFNLPSQLTAADLKGWHFFGIVVLALPAIFGQFTQQGDFRPGQGICTQCVWAVAAGMLASYVLAFVALWFAVVLAPPRTQGSALTFPCLPFMRRWLEWADNHHVLPKGLRLGVWIRENLPCALWRGYLAPDGFMWSGHWLALLFGFLTLGLYFFVGWRHGSHLGQASGATALTFVLLLLLNANWVLSFLAFFLDRFRIPVLVLLALFALVSSNIQSSDHYFEVRKQEKEPQEVFPGDVLRARDGKPIVVIATAGGGIQAAAWTTQVLDGLQKLYGEWYPGKSFAENVTLISSVSGGATGSMYYLNLYDAAQPQHFRAGDLSNLTEMASRSSLDDVAWALVYRDLPRIFFPGGVNTQDRGYALEETWSRRGKLTGTLSGWREGVKEGWRPAAVFNSTIAETGEPLALSTTAWRAELTTEGDKEVSPRRRYFYEQGLYQGQDLRVVTAVRLAATFPYVTPAARPATPRRDDYHMIDGGYYDNYGVSSLIAWLEQGLVDSQREQEEEETTGGVKKKQAGETVRLPRILVIQIRSFPPDEDAKRTKKGWAFQFYAPVKGLLSARSSAQLVRDRESLTMFAHRWDGSKAETAQAKIQFATFEFGRLVEEHKDKAANPPLSWAMNPGQIQAVRDDWNQRMTQNDPNVDRVRCFFDPHFERCDKLSRGPD